MLDEAVEGRAPVIAGGGGVRAVGVDVIEEAGDHVDVEVAEAQQRDLSASAKGGELEQELERVPVGADRKPARPTLTWQIVYEEGLDEREQLPWRRFAHRGGHALRRCCSNRSLASSSN